MIPNKPFEVVQIDLASPLKVMKTGARLKKHVPEKSVWILVVTCQFSRLVFLNALESYSTDSLLIGLQELEATYRRPSKIISDAGTQMVRSIMLILRCLSGESSRQPPIISLEARRSWWG
ncbi:MAG: hypothetical protein GY696_32570 [Gammaproteobacteria bacterium]|nr:hypothetical protein [Gammaproteobacteria bacterium]